MSEPESEVFTLPAGTSITVYGVSVTLAADAYIRTKRPTWGYIEHQIDSIRRAREEFAADFDARVEELRGLRSKLDALESQFETEH